MILRNEFDQISRVEIPKNIANAFIELKNSLRVYPQEKRKEIIEESASRMKSEINEFIDILTGTVGEENEVEGQKNTMGATIRLKGSEEYVKRMQEIKQATRELREENERLNQSLKETVEQRGTWKVPPVLPSATLEDKLIRKSLAILGKKKINETEEKIIADTVRLIEIRHSMNYCER